MRKRDPSKPLCNSPESGPSIKGCEVDRKPVESKVLKTVGYDPASQTLELEFHSGRVYRYADVSPEKHAALMAAESIGKHYGLHIKPHHAATAAESVKQ